VAVGMTAQPTDRELEIFATVMRLHSQKQAAAALGLSPDGVRMATRRLYARLEVDCAAAAAERLGWLRVPECRREGAER